MNPDSAVMCDCGYPFDALAAENARGAGFMPRHEAHPPGPSKAAKVAVGLLGYVLGGFPLVAVAEYRAAQGQGESGLLRLLGFITGLVGVFVALKILNSRHESRGTRS